MQNQPNNRLSGAALLGVFGAAVLWITAKVPILALAATIGLGYLGYQLVDRIENRYRPKSILFAFAYWVGMFLVPVLGVTAFIYLYNQAERDHGGWAVLGVAWVVCSVIAYAVIPRLERKS